MASLLSLMRLHELSILARSRPPRSLSFRPPRTEEPAPPGDLAAGQQVHRRQEHRQPDQPVERGEDEQGHAVEGLIEVERQRDADHHGGTEARRDHQPERESEQPAPGWAVRARQVIPGVPDVDVDGQ